MTDEPKRPDLTPTEGQRRAHALVSSMPKHLKDPANYEKICGVIRQAFSGSCGSHADITEWAGCARCQQRFYERRGVLKKLGFRNAAQYMVWMKIHETIKERIPLAKYNKP